MTQSDPNLRNRHPRPDALRIGLIVNESDWYQTQILAGIRSYARPSLPWWFRVVPHLRDTRLRTCLLAWQPQGVLVVNDSRESLAQLGPKIPAVVVGGNPPASERVPWIKYADLRCGEIAAQHVMGKGVASALAVTNSGRSAAVDRVTGFREWLSAHDIPCEVMDEANFAWTHPIPGTRWIEEYTPLLDRLQQLPKPVAVFGWQDELTAWMLDMAYHHGFEVPSDFLFIGVNNQTGLCESMYPGLSSVTVPFQAAGWEAAAILHRLIRTQNKGSHRMTVAAGDVVERGSTQRVTNADPLLQRLLEQLSHAHALGWNGSTIAGHLGVSKRSLERRCMAGLGKTLLAVRSDARLERAKILLAQNRFTVRGVAEECGFKTSKSLETLFSKRVGMTPGQYRQRSRRQ